MQVVALSDRVEGRFEFTPELSDIGVVELEAAPVSVDVGVGWLWGCRNTAGRQLEHRPEARKLPAEDPVGGPLRDFDSERLGDVDELTGVGGGCRALPYRKSPNVVAEQQLGRIQFSAPDRRHRRYDLGRCAEVDLDAGMLDGELHNPSNDIVGATRHLELA